MKDGQQVIGFDTETYRFSNGNKAPKVVCLTWDDGSGPRIAVGAEIEDRFREFLEGDAILAAHNAAYDSACLARTFPKLQPLIWAKYEKQEIQCTQLREILLDIAKGARGNHTRRKGYYALDSVAERRELGLEIDKNNPWRMRFGELDGVPLAEWPPDALSYALIDASGPRTLFLDQRREAGFLRYSAFYDEAARQATYDFPLYLMHCWGVRTNYERICELNDKTIARLKELRGALREHGIIRPNGVKDTKLVRELICADLPHPSTTKKGAVKTDAAQLKKCSHPGLKAITEYDSLTKKKSTYIDKLWEGVNGNIHARFHTLGADTGRTSCSGPNLQNQSKDGGIRECFEPRPGMIYIIADYDSQETRTLGQSLLDLVGRSSLADKYKADPDYDPHCFFAAQMMGITYEEALERRAAGDPEVKSMRQRAKAANFGFPGGLGAKAFVSYALGYGVKITVAEAKKLKEDWFKAIPEMRDYFTKVNQIAKGGGVLEQVRSGRLRGGVGFCDGANSWFQGLASEASKTATYFVSEKCYNDPSSPLYGCRPVMLIHDELIIEAPIHKAAEAAKEVEKQMVRAMALWCPDVPARATPALCDHWTKDAEAVYEEGVLVPWQREAA